MNDRSLETLTGRIEISKGQRVKTETGPNGELFVDRIISGGGYPVNYGYVEYTLAEDADPADLVVPCIEPIPANARVYVRPVGLLRMMDGESDHKIVAVVPSCPQFRGAAELPRDILERTWEFFASYKSGVQVLGYESADIAVDWIRETQQRYQQQLCGQKLA